MTRNYLTSYCRGIVFSWQCPGFGECFFLNPFPSMATKVNLGVASPPLPLPSQSLPPPPPRGGGGMAYYVIPFEYTY